MNYQRIVILGALCATLGLAACGGDKSPSDSGSETATSAQLTEPAAPAGAAGETPEPASNTALPTTPLDRNAVFGITSETIVETAPCPFLSDSTAVATAKTDYELLRREVSNQECRWSKNAGFSVVVSVAPTATATPLQDRAYNLETPPVIKAQAGPGDAAVILYDTAWETERPYAMGFETGGDLVTIFVTGLETDPDRLTATAQEVAAQLPTAPTIEKQYREILPALQFCTIWPDEAIGGLVGATSEDGLYSAAYGSAGCKWSGGFGANAKTVTLARYKRGDTSLDRMLELGGETISGLGDQAVILTRPAADGYAGDSAIWFDIDDQQFNFTISGTIADHPEVAKTLARNLLSRI